MLFKVEGVKGEDSNSSIVLTKNQIDNKFLSEVSVENKEERWNVFAFFVLLSILMSRRIVRDYGFSVGGIMHAHYIFLVLAILHWWHMCQHFKGILFPNSFSSSSLIILSLQYDWLINYGDCISLNINIVVRYPNKILAGNFICSLFFI